LTVQPCPGDRSQEQGQEDIFADMGQSREKKQEGQNDQSTALNGPQVRGPAPGQALSRLAFCGLAFGRDHRNIHAFIA
jgi:hypothetical protein